VDAPPNRNITELRNVRIFVKFDGQRLLPIGNYIIAAIVPAFALSICEVNAELGLR
jgi:hypothetical protein